LRSSASRKRLFKGIDLLVLTSVRDGCVVFTTPPLSLKGVCMNTAVSFLLLLIFAVLIFGVPVILIAIRLIDAISEERESARRAEGESTAEELTAIEKRAPAEKKPPKDAGEWTPANHMR
jgi:cell division protein FtsB